MSYVSTLTAYLLALVVLSTAAVAADGPRDPSSASSTDSARPERSGTAFLERTWPDHPEWLAMLADILVKGERIDGRAGWFRKAVSQTRFDWPATRTALDKDGDGCVSQAEFGGPNADFA